MTFLKRATFKNFQSHKKTVLHFHEGVNVIVGLTDSGKSAILRGMYWNILNKAKDKGFRSRWGGKTDVELVFSDGMEVSRVKDEHNAYYLVDPANNVDEEYKAFKTEIPEDINNALNLQPLNIQDQYDPPFLLADSGGDVAKLLNKVANIDDIDVAIRKMRSEVNNNREEIITTEALIEEGTKQLEQFKYLKQMEKDVIALETLEQEQTNLIVAERRLSTLIVNAIEKQNELNEILTFLTAESELQAALTLNEQLKATTGQIKCLERYISNIDVLNYRVQLAENMIAATDELNAVFEFKRQRLDIATEEYDLKRIIIAIVDRETTIHDISVFIENKTDELKKELDGIDECPFCEQHISLEWKLNRM